MSDAWIDPTQTALKHYVADVTASNPILHNARWTVHQASEALEPQPPIEYLVDTLIQRGCVHCFFGDGGSKKTYSLMHMGVMVASGSTWLGMKTTKGSVLLIDEESGTRRVNRRLREIILGEAVEPEIPFLYVSDAHFKLDDARDSVLLESLILESKSDLVIIDALADVMVGDENAKMFVQPVFEELKRIARNTNAALLIIHHTNKSGAYRGSSAIKDAVDTLIQVTSEDGSGRIDFKSEKNRDGELLKFSATATWENDHFCLTRTEKVEALTLGKAQNYVLRYLEEHGPSTIKDIMAGADICAPNGARSAVYSLADIGKIRRTNPGASIMTSAICDLAERGE